MNNYPVIMAVLQEKRVETAAKVQAVLTQYGCYIRLRLGLHDNTADLCSADGLILLQVCGENGVVEQLQAELQAIPAVKVKWMALDF